MNAGHSCSRLSLSRHPLHVLARAVVLDQRSASHWLGAAAPAADPRRCRNARCGRAHRVAPRAAGVDTSAQPPCRSTLSRTWRRTPQSKQSRLSAAIQAYPHTLLSKDFACSTFLWIHHVCTPHNPRSPLHSRPRHLEWVPLVACPWPPL